MRSSLKRLTSQWDKFCAWNLTVTLVVTQISAGVVWAAEPTDNRDTLRIQATLESGAGIGLEEAMSGPTVIERVAESGVQIARRNIGEVVASGGWEPTPTDVTGNALNLSEAGAVNAAVREHLVEGGLQWLQTHIGDAPVAAVVGRFDSSGRPEIPIRFVENHATLFDWRPATSSDSGEIFVDVSVNADLLAERFQPGLTILGAMLFHHAASRATGDSSRQAYHHMIAFYENLSEGDRTELHNVLETEWVDHGNTLLSFLRLSTDPEAVASEAPVDLNDARVRGINSMQLEDQLQSETNAGTRTLLLETVQHRDRLVSWLIGQSLIDLPYDRYALAAAAENEEIDLEERRAQAAVVVRSYDRAVEQANAERVSTHVRESSPNGHPAATVVAGRLSRAFSNQAMLFSASRLVARTEGVVSAVTALDELAQGERLLRQLRVSAERDPFMQPQMLALMESLQRQMNQLQPALSRLRLLATEQDAVAPLTQYQGAIRQLRDLLQVLRNRSQAGIQRSLSGEIEALTEGTARQATAEQAARIRDRFEAFEAQVNAFAAPNGTFESAIRDLEVALAEAESVAAAFSVQLQRPSANGSINFHEANALLPKPEQEPALQKLVRLGGHNTYASPDMGWLDHVTDVIEAAPLFVYERVIDLGDGRHVTVFEVDQEALEQTMRQMADHWATNIDHTMDSEHVALARETVVESNATLRGQVQGHLDNGLNREEAYLEIIREADEDTQTRVARVAAYLDRQFDDQIEAVETRVEEQWQQKNFITRMDSVRTVIIAQGDRITPSRADYQRIVDRSRRNADRRQAIQNRMNPWVLLRRRNLPAFHMLTTEAPGLVEGFIQTVLEEEMALRNVIRGEGQRLDRDLEGQVRERQAAYREHIVDIGEQVIAELGYEAEVTRYLAENDGAERPAAVLSVIGSNVALQDEVARIAVLGEVHQAQVRADATESYIFDPANPHPRVGEILESDRAALEVQARAEVWQNNQFDSDLREAVAAQGDVNAPTDENLREAIAAINDGDTAVFHREVESTVNRLARERALEQLNAEMPELGIEQQLQAWYRNHTSLGRTQARREVIAANKLNDKMLDPRYYYGSGATFQQQDETFQATGRRKRFHLIYAPSRVNLGKGERDSVEVLPQWVGVTDPLAAEHAAWTYGLINYYPQIVTIQSAENLKTGENTHTAMRRSIANAQAYFVEGLGFGDFEHMSAQFNMRGSFLGADTLEKTGLQAGPNCGYCIPKDPLFGLFRNDLKDGRKLSQIGVPDYLHAPLQTLILRMEDERKNFSTAGEFENWVAQNLLTEEGLRQHFSNDDAEIIGKVLGEYISLKGGVLVFHLTKLHQILGMTGRPSLLARHGHDLGRLLWSSWAGRKVVLGGEQVNRATVLEMERDVFQLLEQARRLNPDANVPADDQARVHLFGPYKGDPDAPSPPDVRFSASIRVMLGLADMGEKVAHDLDHEGQLIWRATRYGIQIDSDAREDQQVLRYLAGEFLDMSDDDVRSSAWYLNEWAQLTLRELNPNDFARESAALLDAGFAQAVRELRDAEDPRIGVLLEEFPGYGTVGDITVTVVPGVSGDDFMKAHSDAETAMTEAADATELLLGSEGLTQAQMQAHANLGEPVDRWFALTGTDLDRVEEIKGQVGGKIHALSFRLKGPGVDFGRDIQGQDAIVFFTVHPDLLALEPSQIRDRMLTGKPNSALAIRDGSGQGRHRVWFDMEEMLWYASGRGIDNAGNRIPVSDWSRRDTEGRKAVYTTFAKGDKDWQPLLGTNLREEAIRQEHRASRLYDALAAVANADDDAASEIEAAQALFAEVLSRKQMTTEARLAAEYQTTMQLKGTDKPRDNLIRQAKEDLARGLSIQDFTAEHWMAIGGIFLLHGAERAEVAQVVETLKKAQDKLQSAGLEESEADRLSGLGLVTYAETADSMMATERSTQMFSVKAAEEKATRALAKRRALEAEARRHTTLAHRQRGFDRVVGAGEEQYHAAQIQMNALVGHVAEAGDAQLIYETMGQMYGHTVNAMIELNASLFPGDAITRNEINEQIQAAITGRGFSEDAEALFNGDYENQGLISRWYEQAGPDRREDVAQIASLFTAAYAIEQTAAFAAQPREQVDEAQLWRELSIFFAHTLNDHFYEYNPWAYDSKRTTAYAEFYDGDTGQLAADRREDFYGLSWQNHRLIHAYVQALIHTKTPLADEDESDRDLLMGRVTLGATAADDTLVVEGIGAGAPASNELLWRAFGQLREVAFMRNSGFEVPPVFEGLDANDPDILNASEQPNFTFMAPVGRDHYSKALSEGPSLGANLFYTRNGEMVELPSSKGPVLQISNAHFYLSEAQYKVALMRNKGLDNQQAEDQIAADKAAGRFEAKGIRVAATFKEPVVVGSVIAFHNHHLTDELTAAGYPYTVLSPAVFDWSYDKTLYPDTFNPAQETGVLLPPEVKWLQSETETIGDRVQAVAQIKERIRGHALQHPSLVIKGAAESGSRNLKRFDLVGQDGQLSEATLTEAAEFTYRVSQGQNVSIQKMVLTTPFAWMSAEATQDFVDRQAHEYGVAVQLQRHPKAWVYGTTRAVTTAGIPANLEPTEEGLFNPDNWSMAHAISIRNTQIATNVGRQGTLDKLTEDKIREEVRKQFLPEMEAAAQRVMVATARYMKWYWDNVFVPEYRETHEQAEPREFDASGVPYWWPRYLMLDFLPEAVFGRDGSEVPPGTRIVDVIPGDPEAGTQNRFILQAPGESETFEGEIMGVKFWLLEPNVGFGLWRNYWIREQVEEEARAAAASDDVNWNNVGVADRMVLQDWLDAGSAFLSAQLGDDYFSDSGQPQYTPAPPVGDIPQARATVETDNTPFGVALRNVRQTGLVGIGPEQVSVILEEAALAHLGGRELNRDQNPVAIYAAADDWLQQAVERAAEFPQGTGISVTPADVQAFLEAPFYRQRVAERVVDRVLSEPLTGPVQIAPAAMSDAEVGRLLNQDNTFAVVSGQTTLLNHQVHPWAINQASSNTNVIGVYEGWLDDQGRATRFQVYEAQTGRYREIIPETPVQLNQAFIVDLDTTQEVAHHQRIDTVLTTAGVRVLNPAQISSVRADDKAWLRNNAPRSSRAPAALSFSSGTIGNLAGDLESAFADQTAFVVQPQYGTEGQAVQVVRGDDPASARSAVRTAVLDRVRQGSVLVSPFVGNVTYQGRPVTIRFNVIAGRVASATAVVGNTETGIASLGRDGEVLPLDQVLNGLRQDEQDIVMTPMEWQSLQRQAEAAATATGLDIVGVDMQLERASFDIPLAGEDEWIRGFVLEANARPGFMIHGERVQLTSTGIQSQAAGLLTPTFEHFTLQNTWSATMADWTTLLEDTSRAAALLEPHYPAEMVDAKRRQMLFLFDELQDTRKVQTNAGQPAFDTSQPLTVVRTPGRTLLPTGGRHLDYIGGQAGSVGFPTRQETIGFVQFVETDSPGSVEVYAVDPPEGVVDHYEDGKPRVISLTDPNVFPDRRIRTLDEWDAWAREATARRKAERHPDEKVNYADDMVGAALAMLSTEFGDPSGRFRAFRERLLREGRGIRIAITGDLPTSGGLSSSSTILETTLQAMNDAADIGLNQMELIRLGFAERVYTGVQAGTKDHAHMMSQPGFLGVEPARVIGTMPALSSAEIVVLDSGVARDNAPDFSAKMRSSGNDEDNIKARTGAAYAYVDLWIRTHRKDIAERLGPFTAANPYGLLRNLHPNSEGGLTLQELYQLLRDIPAEGLSRDDMRTQFTEFGDELQLLFDRGEEPPENYPLREYAAFFFGEEARNYETVRLLNELDTRPETAVLADLAELTKVAHDGDRVVTHAIEGSVDTPAEVTWTENAWDWRLDDATLDGLIQNHDQAGNELWRLPGWLERSIEPIDLLVDLIEYFNQHHGGGVAAGVVTGAGLGGVVTIVVQDSLRPELITFLEGTYYRQLELDHGSVIISKPGQPGSVIEVSQEAVAGLEEETVTQTTAEDVTIVDSYTGMPLTIPSTGLRVSGYTLASGGLAPDALIEAGLLEPGESRLLVPPAVMDGSQQLFVQQGLLSSNVLEALRVQGVSVTEFLLSDIPAPVAEVPSTYIAAVPHGSDAESRMRRGGTMVNLYGSTPATRPTTLSSLATLIHIATQQNGFLRVNGIFVDDVSGIVAIDLFA